LTRPAEGTDELVTLGWESEHPGVYLERDSTLAPLIVDGQEVPVRDSGIADLPGWPVGDGFISCLFDGAGVLKATSYRNDGTVAAHAPVTAATGWLNGVVKFGVSGSHFFVTDEQHDAGYTALRTTLIVLNRALTDREILAVPSLRQPEVHLLRIVGDIDGRPVVYALAIEKQAAALHRIDWAL
jgi:hypothetical protein